MKRRLALCTSVPILLSVALATGAASAETLPDEFVYDVVLTVPGAPVRLSRFVFALANGDMLPDNVVRIESLHTDGYLGQPVKTTGSTSGDAVSGIVIWDGSNFVSRWVQQEASIAERLSFRLRTTKLYPHAENPGHPADQFSFAVLESNSDAGYLTSDDPTTANALFTLDLRPGSTPTIYRPGPGRAPAAWTVTVTPVPEPGAAGSVAAIAALLWIRRRRKGPHRLAALASVALLVQAMLSPAARALGPLSPAPLAVEVASPRVNEREGTLDYPVTITNPGPQVVAGPIHVRGPYGLQNRTVTTHLVQGEPSQLYATLPTGLAPGQSFTQIFRVVPRTLETPAFTPFVEAIGPVDPATAPAPQITNARPGEYVVHSDTPLRIRAVVGQEWLWDIDATNPNGGTLAFSLGPIPSPKPDLAGANPVTGASIEPLTGVMRWTPPAAGLYAARLTISDGVADATTHYDFAFQVEAGAPPSLACTGYTTWIYEPGQEHILNYTTSAQIVEVPNVQIPPGRELHCTPEAGAIVGEGNHTIRCETTDRRWPNESCEFVVSVAPSYPIVVIDLQEYVNLRIEQGDCRQTIGELPPCNGEGAGRLLIRNTGLGTAHDVTLTLPYPPEADRNNQLLRSTAAVTSCERTEDSPLVCHLGDLPGGQEIVFQTAYAPTSMSPYFSPVLASVSTSTPELSTHDNTAILKPTQWITGPFAEIKICTGDLLPDGYLEIPDDISFEECSEIVTKAWAKYNAERACRERHRNSHALTGLLGDPCEKQPEWFKYVIMGVMAVGVITGAGAFYAAGHGAYQTVIFLATEAGGFLL